MRQTTYNIYDRRIVWAEGTSITGNENVDKFHFEFDSEWDEFEAKFMVLIVDGTSYIDQLDAENNVTLRNVVYDKENVEFGVYGIDTDTSAKLSTNIIGIETTESIWGRIRDISDLPSKTQWEIYTEEMLALLAQGSITLEACQQALTDALSAKETTKGYMDTTEGYKNTTKGYMDTTEGYKQDVAGLKQDTINIVSDFNANVDQKTTDFNSNASSKTTDFNNNASSKTNDFNSNYTDKLGTFNSNATSKTTDFNDNASSKTTTFNSNATNKTTAFNNNASSKTDDYNSNATSKTTAFNENYTEKYNAVTLAGTTAVGNVQTAENTAITNIETAGSSYDARINDLLDQIPVGTVEYTDINVQDSSDLPIKDIEIIGNTTQDDTKRTYKCAGTETGDYYFVYDSTNYQFTMPTISANDVLVFDTTTLKLYQGTTEITTTTASTGTLITLSTTPSPDYPQPISVVTGDNTVNVIGKNLLEPKAYLSKIAGTKICLVNTTQITSPYSASAYRGVAFVCRVKAGKTYTISNDVTGIYYKGITIYKNINDITEPSKSIQTVSMADVNLATFTSNYDGYAVFGGTTSSSKTVTWTYSQVEIGSTATTYEPYTAQTQLLSLGSMELAKIGDYQDYIWHDEESGKWYKHNVIGRTTYTGSASESWTSATSTLTGTTRFYITNNNVITNSNGSDTNIYVLANSLTGMSFKDLYNGNGVANAISNYTGSNLNHRFNVRIETSIASDVTAFKTWLASNNLVVYFVLQTPVDEEITDTTLIEQLDALYDLQTYKNVTNIFTVTNNEEPILNLTYRKDLQTMFNNLTNAIVSLGNNI